MDRYFIEYRFNGRSKSAVRKLIQRVNREFGIKKCKSFPHITLVGSFTTGNERRLIADFNKTCSEFPLMYFEIDGFDTFKDTKVVFLNIIPDKNLRKFRWKLSNRLKNYCRLTKYDYMDDFKFHSTIVMNLNDEEIKKIKRYVDKFDYDCEYGMVRITLLKNGKILREYDYILRRPFTRKLALYSSIFTYHLNISNCKKKGILAKIKKILKKFKSIF